jgi:tetratricopeptide (TPR) repeat protein
LHKAEQIYREVLRVEPQHLDALFLLGMVARQAGRNDVACEYFGQVLRCKPDYAEAHNNLGNALAALGRLDEAAASYRRAIALKPDLADAHNGLGAALTRQGKADEAVASCRQALRLRPNYALAQVNLGNALKDLGRLDDAVACYHEALRLQPDMLDAYNHLGLAHAARKEWDEALACYRRALQLQPRYFEGHVNLGNALAAAGDRDAAIASYRQALQIKPDHADTHYNLGIALADQGDFDAAVASYRRALQINPGMAQAWDNLGHVLLAQGKPAEALACYEEALRRQPDFAKAHMSRALAWLRQGELERGWAEYEWRWQCEEFVLPTFRCPRWDGSPLAGRTILLSAEQGLGDTMHFIRYAPLVKQRGGTVIAACQKPLVPLLGSCRGIDRLVAFGADLPDFDVWAPLMSLPALLGTSLATIPAEVPYLFARSDLVEHWRRELGPIGGFKVGICWQGSPGNRGDRDRSIPLAEFAALARLPGVRLVSLQKGHGTEQLPGVADQFSVIDLGSRLDEASGAFMDTAAVLMSLDLVVTVDTATAHLAGALGVPVWLGLSFVADWRWLLHREDSPWYPTMRLFRQTRRGDWAGVLARMAEELTKRLAQTPRAGAIRVEIAPGELIDKITILQIKSERIADPAKLANVRRELAELTEVCDREVAPSAELTGLAAELKEVNEALWRIEDDIRDCERRRDFGPAFVELARSVYRENDRRAALKRRINDLLGSRIVEEKSYRPYDPSR